MIPSVYNRRRFWALSPVPEGPQPRACRNRTAQEDNNMTELFEKSIRTLELPRVLGLLAEQAVKAALSDYYTRQGIDPEPIVGHVKKDVHEGEEAEGACPSCATCDH